MPTPRDEKLLRDTIAMLANFVWTKQLRPGEHMWTIPVDPQRDFDCILTDAVDELVNLRAQLQSLTADLTRMQQEEHRIERDAFQAGMMAGTDHPLKDEWIHAAYAEWRRSGAPPWTDALLTQLNDIRTQLSAAEAAQIRLREDLDAAWEAVKQYRPWNMETEDAKAVPTDYLQCPMCGRYNHEPHNAACTLGRVIAALSSLEGSGVIEKQI